MTIDASLTPYERAQTTAIERWKAEEPGVVSQAVGVVTRPIAWLVNKVVPEAAIRAALSASNTVARWATDTADVMRDGRVSSIDDLRAKDLELSDRLADEVHNWAIGLAAAEGAGTGFFGILSAPVDVPAIITLALRTIHKVGVCYGYECTTPEDEQFVLGILSASGANSVEEKLAALATLSAMQRMVATQTWKKMAESQVGKEAAVTAIRSLAKQLGINITKRRALAAIPIIGAAIGGSVNAWYIREVGWAARRMFQERWLIDNGKMSATSVPVAQGA